MMKRQMYLITVVVAFAYGTMLNAAEWPFWRGPNHNSRTDEAVNPAKFTGTPEPLWSVQVGEGYAGIAVAGGRAFTVGYSEGHAYCFNTRSGTIVWQEDLPAAFGARRPRWDFSASVRIVGNMALINANQHGIALDKNTGRKIWASPPGIGSYPVPSLYHLDGEPRIAIFGQKHLHGVRLSDGNLLWSFPWENSVDVHATDAEISGPNIFISSSYGSGSVVLDIASGEPEVVWRNRRLQSNFGICIIHDGAIYGFDGEAGKRVAFKCLDLNDGQELWAERMPFGSFLVAAGDLVIVTEHGDMMLVRLQKIGYEEIYRAQAPETRGRYWTPPSLADGRLFIRCSNGSVVVFDVSP